VKSQVQYNNNLDKYKRVPTWDSILLFHPHCDIPNNIYNSLLLPMAELPNPTPSFPPSQSGFGSLDQEFRGEYKTPQQLMGISAVFVHPATKYSVALGFVIRSTNSKLQTSQMSTSKT